MQDGENKLELVLDVATRWNSTFSMLERLCCLQAPVRQVLSNAHIVKPGSAAHLELRDSQWTIIQILVEKLKPIKLATDYFEGEKYVSIRGVIPIVKGLATNFAPCEEDSRTLPL